MTRPRHRRPARIAGRSFVAIVGAALLGLAWGTSGTLSGWAAGSVTNSASTVQTDTLAFTHAYQSTSCAQGIRSATTAACSGSIAPTAATPASGAVTGTDVITNNGTYGTAQLQSEFTARSCAPVKLDNRKASANPLLPRYGATVHTSGGPMDSAGYLSLDGGSPGGYATSVVSQAQPPTGVLGAGTFSGVGIWFKASTGTSGPLFSFSASPSNGAAVNDDRALYLDSGGKLNLVWNTSGSKIGPSANSYTDGSWHFAYVTFGGVNVALIGLIPQVTLWVDGVQQATTPLLSLSPLSTYNGYWHLGWAPTSVTGLGSAYVGASVSNFVVINSTSAPAGNTIGKPTTQSGFNSATTASTEHWLLNDPGTTTFAGTLPSSMAAPCSMISIAWAVTGSAAGTVTAATPLSSFADGGWHAIPAPAAGATQTSTVTTARGGGYNADVSGLHLYAPLSHRVQTLPTGSGWVQVFTWAGAEEAFIA